MLKSTKGRLDSLDPEVGNISVFCSNVYELVEYGVDATIAMLHDFEDLLQLCLAL